MIIEAPAVTVKGYTVAKNLYIKASDVIIENSTINGDVFIDESVGDGTVSFKNSTVKGTVYINGGGVTDIELIDCTLNEMEINKEQEGVAEPVRIAADGDTNVKKITVISPAVIENDGIINTIDVKSTASNTEVVNNGTISVATGGSSILDTIAGNKPAKWGGTIHDMPKGASVISVPKDEISVKAILKLKNTNTEEIVYIGIEK